MPFKDLVNEILSSTDIIQLVSEYVPLKRSGRSYKALCPFHPEKTPSFFVAPEKSIFYCFGCGKGGNAIKFLQEISGLTFMEALEKLSERVGIPIKKNKYISDFQKEGKQRRRELLDINLTALRFFQDCLFLNEGELCRDYIKSRGLSPEIIKKFNLGFSKDLWDSLYLELRRKGSSINLASSLGLIVEKEAKEGGFYDKFRGRLMFPVFGLSGEVLGFGGRILSDKKDEPKYINSNDSEIFKKGEILFGLYQAKEAIKKNGSAIIVEGYIDALSMVQSGFENTVAPMGTALTLSQIRLLSRFCEKIIILMDGDDAGKRASLKCVEAIIEARMEGFVGTLPDGDDPDSFLKKYGREKLENILSEAKGSLDFALQEIKKKYGETPRGIAKTLEEIGEIISRETDPLIYRKYIEDVAKKLAVNVEDVHRFIKSKKERESLKKDFPPMSGKEKEFLGIIIHNQRFLDMFLKENGWQEWFLSEEVLEIIKFMLSHLYKTEDELVDGMINEFPEGVAKSVFMNILMESEKFADAFEEEKAFRDIMKSLKKDFLERKKRELISEIQRLNNKEEEKKNILGRKLVELTQQMQKLL